ncbi:MAG TPA: metal-dependent phosphohydrolase [Phycisphaerales bacterium]|nr:metal-dependent phosphohydrolase [Phycisphaerales bacterium]
MALRPDFRHDPELMTPADPRENASDVARHLQQNGHVAYFAGGCVRDRLLGLEPLDYDIATDATPDRVKALFPHSMSVGESFGVMLVRRGGHTLEVATFRSDGRYVDGRHPESVRFGTEVEDAARRDFTINAMFEDPLSGRVIDHFNGRSDLESRILRAVGVPSERLTEDRLRVLRAIRFAARFTLEIEAATASALQADPALRGVSRERVGGELRRMLAHPTRTRAVELLESFSLDSPVLGPSGDPGAPRPALAGLSPVMRDPIDGLAAWLLDRAAPPGRAMIRQLREGLLLSNKEERRLDAILSLVHRVEDDWDQAEIAVRKRLAAREEFPTVLELIEARNVETGVRIRTDFTALEASGLAPTPLLSGEDLIAAGLVPGPLFKEILDRTYDAQLEGILGTPEEALAHGLKISNTAQGDR